MCYADITRNDRNPIKRFFQRRRLSDALALAGMSASPRNIIDFGAGDGEFCRLLANRFPDARIFCYEPVSSAPAGSRRSAERQSFGRDRRFRGGVAPGASRPGILHGSRRASSRPANGGYPGGNSRRAGEGWHGADWRAGRDFRPGDVQGHVSNDAAIRRIRRPPEKHSPCGFGISAPRPAHRGNFGGHALSCFIIWASTSASCESNCRNIFTSCAPSAVPRSGFPPG